MSNAMQMIGQPVEDFYYESEKTRYMAKDAYGIWMAVSERSLKLRLAQKGYDTEKGKGDLISMADSMMLRIQQEHNVMYAGPLAGYGIGMCEQGGYNILVTHERKHIEPVGIEWPTIGQIIDAQFKDVNGGLDQTPYLHTWVKMADESLNSAYHDEGIKSFTPGPALAIAGPKNCGKTLLSMILRKLLGGRSAKPYRYMMGQSTFNKELLGSELLVIDDEISSTDLRTRRAFGYQIKNMLFAENQSGHGKNKDAFTLYPFWRMLILLNDEPESLLLLPPLDESIDDKVMLLKSSKNERSVMANSQQEKVELAQKIDEELPAYLGWLRYSFQVPKECYGDRTGVHAFKHPALLAALTTLTPEDRLMTVIDDALFGSNDYEHWQGTANQLSKDLCEGPFKHDARALLSWSNACGTYLGRLAKSHPERFVQMRGASERGWRIVAPKREVEHTDRAGEGGMSALDMFKEAARDKKQMED